MCRIMYTMLKIRSLSTYRMTIINAMTANTHVLIILKLATYLINIQFDLKFRYNKKNFRMKVKFNWNYQQDVTYHQWDKFLEAQQQVGKQDHSRLEEDNPGN